jgi:hypothetical protein
LATVRSKLPTRWPEREALRQKGQFWTPDWVADAMVAFVAGGGAHVVFDPAVGAGAFLRAAKRLSRTTGTALDLRGMELDAGALEQALVEELSDKDLSEVVLGDFLARPDEPYLDAVVANPPYIRHHRIDAADKRRLRGWAAQLTGQVLDGRAGLHVYFLLKGLRLLRRAGRLAYILPADTCEGVFADQLWRWIVSRYRLHAVVTFAPEASPFPGVDTNPVIVMIENAEPSERLQWVRCLAPDGSALTEWVQGHTPTDDALEIVDRNTDEGVSTGLTRPPREGTEDGVVLGDVARVVRGIATGSNEFFHLTRRQAQQLELPPDLLVPAIGRTRDIPGDVLDSEAMEAVDRAGRPSLLFSPDARSLALFPEAARRYLERGENEGLAERKLIGTRRPWYRMEHRDPPPIMFAYLGRRNARFVRNLTSAVPLTGFLCIYPHDTQPEAVDRLFLTLNHPDTVANLRLVGKSYGGGAIKVEPRALERLLIPRHVADRVGLKPAEPLQLSLGITDKKD